MSRLVGLGVVAMVLVVIAIFATQPARACSPSQGPLGTEVFPPDGRSDIPRNAALWISIPWFHDEEIEAQVRASIELRDADGVTVPAVLTDDLQLIPSADLTALTTYTVYSRFPAASRSGEHCSLSWADCLSEQTMPVSAFTTASAVDLEAPEFGGILGLESEFVKNSSCIGNGVYLDFVFFPATDSGTHPEDIRYNLYRFPNLTEPVRKRTRWLGGDQTCGENRSPDGGSLPPGSYVARALDLTGAEDSNTVVFELGNACGESAEQAPPTFGNGCSAGSDSPPVGLWPALLLLLGLRRRASTAASESLE